MRRIRKIIRLVWVSLVLLMALLFVCIIASLSYRGYAAYRGQKFDRTIWDQRKTTEVCGMYTDIKDNILKTGMTRATVESLLGKTNPLDNINYSKNNMAYAIGLCRSWDVNFMVIEFDEHDRLQRVTNYQN